MADVFVDIEGSATHPLVKSAYRMRMSDTISAQYSDTKHCKSITKYRALCYCIQILNLVTSVF